MFNQVRERSDESNWKRQRTSNEVIKDCIKTGEVATCIIPARHETHFDISSCLILKPKFKPDKVNGFFYVSEKITQWLQWPRGKARLSDVTLDEFEVKAKDRRFRCWSGKGQTWVYSLAGCATKHLGLYFTRWQEAVINRGVVTNEAHTEQKLHECWWSHLKEESQNIFKLSLMIQRSKITKKATVMLDSHELTRCDLTWRSRSCKQENIGLKVN